MSKVIYMEIETYDEGVEKLKDIFHIVDEVEDDDEVYEDEVEDDEVYEDEVEDDEVEEDDEVLEDEAEAVDMVLDLVPCACCLQSNAENVVALYESEEILSEITKKILKYANSGHERHRITYKLDENVSDLTIGKIVAHLVWKSYQVRSETVDGKTVLTIKW